MHEALDDAETHDRDDQQGLVFKNVAHDQPEGDRRQDNRQDKADHIAFERAVAGAIMVMMVVAMRVVVCVCFGTHQRTPMR
ncbi:hypothetical protein D3C78_1092750 [compost metagenome]